MRAIGVAATGLSLLVAGKVLPRRRYQLAGRTAIVTGGSRGLGLLVAKELLRHGARVALCARDPGELERAASWLRDRVDGARVIAVSCDVSDPSAVQAMVDKVQASYGPIDVLVNDAGVIQVGPEDTVRAMGLVSRALPRPEHTGAALPGKDVDAAVKESAFVAPGRHAAEALNEPLH